MPTIGYYYQGSCYSTFDEAIAKFSGNFPQVISGNMTQYLGIGIVNDHDFTYQTGWYSYPANVAPQWNYSDVASGNFQECTLVENSVSLDLSAPTDPHLILIIAACILFGIGFNSGRA